MFFPVVVFPVVMIIVAISGCRDADHEHDESHQHDLQRPLAFRSSQHVGSHFWFYEGRIRRRPRFPVSVLRGLPGHDLHSSACSELRIGEIAGIVDARGIGDRAAGEVWVPGNNSAYCGLVRCEQSTIDRQRRGAVYTNLFVGQ